MFSKSQSLFRFGQPRPNQLLQDRAALESAFASGEESAAGADLNALDAAERTFALSQYKVPPPPPGAGPYRMPLADLLGQDRVNEIQQNGKFIFHTVGDTGQHGHGGDAQESVAFHMEQQVNRADLGPLDKPSILYHLGDVVYYNGEITGYPEQFYDPYANYLPPIVAIPGNHDGDNVPSENSLQSFVQNFCTPTPVRPPMPGQSMRLTMTQPNYYFTLEAPFVNIIGLYSNTTGDLDDPHGGSTAQFDWLVQELQAADSAKFLTVAVHHPPFSADTTHGGEKKIGHALDRAFEQAARLPHLVLAAHVHDYQRFSRIQKAGNLTRTIPYLVAGAGGYAGYTNLHQVLLGLPLPPGVTLEASNDELPGFLTITATADILTCEYYTAPAPPLHNKPNHPATLFETLAIPILQ